MVTTEQMDTFVAYLTQRRKEYWDSMKFTHDRGQFVYTKGPKQFKVIHLSNQRTVFAFVNRETGDIYKPAGWSAPAKHARGNMLTPEGMAKAMALDGSSIRYLS